MIRKYENRIREIRFFNDILQIELALKNGLHFSTLSRIERGYIRATDAQKRLIAKALKCDIENVFPLAANKVRSSNK